MEREPLTDVLRVVSPAILTESLKVGLFTGVIGLGIGSVAGTVKRTTPILFALVSGLQCSAIGSTFWATRSFTNVWQVHKSGSDMDSLSPRQKTGSSTFAGFFTGGFLGYAMRGTQNVMPGMFVFSSVGFLGQTAVNAWERRHANHQPSEAPPKSMLERIANSRFFPMKKLSDAEYEDILKEKLLRVEADIAIIDQNIEKAEAEMGLSSDATKPNEKLDK